MNSTSVFDLTKFKGITSQIQTNTILKDREKKDAELNAKFQTIH
jgi:hypothetical protein